MRQRCWSLNVGMLFARRRANDAVRPLVLRASNAGAVCVLVVMLYVGADAERALILSPIFA